MRIKINLAQMTPKIVPTTYWLYVDLTNILIIKQLKEKVQRLLKVSQDIELYLDNVSFLDEDDIHAINENEEIIIKVKDGNNCTVPNDFNAETNYSNGNIIPNDTTSLSSQYNLDFVPVHINEIPSSLLSPKKRVRKRTHNKSKQKVKPVDVENSPVDFQHDISVPPFKETRKMHKRFKEENENNQDVVHESIDEHLEVSREVFFNTYSPLNPKITKTTVQTKNKGSTFKSPNVPIFVRGKMSTAENSTPNGSFTENHYDKTVSSTDEDCDMLVVDWKNMCAVKLSNISELQNCDLLQFKTLSMNERGEPEMSSVITARVNKICHETSHLSIQILSGIKEFAKLQIMNHIDDEERGIEFEVEYNDLYETFKLT